MIGVNFAIVRLSLIMEMEGIEHEVYLYMQKPDWHIEDFLLCMNHILVNCNMEESKD